MGWTDRIKGWLRGGGAEVAVIEGSRGVAQGSPDAIQVIPKDIDPVILPFVHGNSPMDLLAGQLRVGNSLLEKYVDFEMMDDTPELSTVLDICADDATVVDVRRNHCVWPVGSDRVARDVMADLLYKRLRAEDDAWGTIRTMCKYGIAPAEIVAGDKGVVGLNYLPPATVRKVLDHKGVTLGYVQSVTGNFSTVTSETFPKLLKERHDGPNKDGIVVFQPWEIVWWQMPSRQVRAPYGVSVLDSARWPWKRLTMLEDAAVVFRLTKAPSRFAVYVECGQIPPRERMAYVRQVKQLWRKNKVLDPATGQIDFRANPAGMDEDLFIPVTDGKEATRVDTLQGPDFNIIDDLEYFRDKVMAATPVPNSYLGIKDQEITRAALSQKDVMFARSEMRLQRQYMKGLMQVARLHFALLDVDPDQVDVALDMTVPSSILEMSQIEAGNARAALAQGCADFYDRRTILVEVMGKSEAEAEAIIRARREDAEAQADLDAETQKKLMGAQMGGGLEGGIGAPESPEGAGEEQPGAEEFAQETEAMRKRLDTLAESLDRMGVTARRTEQRVQRLPVEVRRMLRAVVNQ
jgi:hypothetical protein